MGPRDVVDIRAVPLSLPLSLSSSPSIVRLVGQVLIYSTLHRLLYLLSLLLAYQA